MHKLLNNIDTITYMKNLRRFIGIISIFIIICTGITAYAANALIAFGSESYDTSDGTEFPIGMYISSDEGTGEFQIELSYDNRRLKYQSGATSVDENNGIITIKGNSLESGSIRYWLRFKAISGGDAFIRVKDYRIMNASNSAPLNVASVSVAPIHISGVDVVGVNVDQQSTNGGYQDVGYSDNSSDENVEEEGLSLGNFGSNIIDGAGELFVSTKDIVTANPVISIFILASFIALINIIVILISYINNNKKAKTDVEEVYSASAVAGETTGNDNNIYKSKDSKIVLPPVPRVVDKRRMNDVEGKDYRELDKPVIKIRKITMVFNLSNSDASGLKEYIIQRLKRQVEYNKLYALREVSFNVYKGEIVGIIGSNGSGKSTLLKIVPGALRPTKGEVEVDRRKVQLLTLGTGFDYELTARENVYLNGAIIGYSREFIDTHYDEIVEFAELEDFMDQKVKNFSSGMVSRLGFSIATAGDAAEILILDEVLSVGDVFFRKKSLKRIKEMIHGGSTVLMVSHGMGTIIDHCTKCVWIEKGILRMIDEPQIVCEEYKKVRG